MGRPIRQKMPETQINEVELRDIFNRLESIEAEVKKVVRQQDQQGKSIQILDRDMDGFDDTAKKVQSLSEKFGTFEHVLKTHIKDQENKTKDIEAEVQGVRESVTLIVGELRNVISNEFDAVIDTIKSKKTALKTPSFWRRLFPKKS